MIVEIFSAIQGEGRLAGAPSVFLVTSEGPALTTWCSEPKGSWRPDPIAMHGTIFSNARRRWYDYLVFTGGEPFGDPELGIFAEGLKQFEQHITIESFGSAYAEVPCDLVSINCKLKNPSVKKKGGAKFPEYDIEIVKQLIAKYDYQLKFEVSTPEDMDEVQEVVRSSGALREKVFLIPTATKAKDLKTQIHWIHDACRVLGYRFGPRFPGE